MAGGHHLKMKIASYLLSLLKMQNEKY